MARVTMIGKCICPFERARRIDVLSEAGKRSRMNWTVR